MMSSTPSSLSRYRPAILTLLGAAAAYAAWRAYTSVTSTPPEGLHRSNAVRRANPRTRRATGPQRIFHLLNHPSIPLGDIDVFGNEFILDGRNIITPEFARHLAEEANPTITPEEVDRRLAELYDDVAQRLLAQAGRPLTAAELDAVIVRIVTTIPHQGLVRALQRHRNEAGRGEGEAGTVAADRAESVVPTEASFPSDEDTEGGVVDVDGQTLQRTLYHIAEDRARHEGVIHRGITCNGCDAMPIRGTRWRCVNCPDFDLCSDCEATFSHTKTHIFYKIRVPAPSLSLPKQEPVYPGRPHLMSASINPVLKKRLVSETRMEAEEIEGLYDQFTCLAATEWEADPNGVGYAMDRRSFNHAFVPRYPSFNSAPNLIYDRVFAYFDSDHNTLIGLEELIKGLDGLHSTNTLVKLRIAFNGYDVDGDGYISRKDVLRIFRARYAMDREATRNHLAEAEEELSVRGALEMIHSAQPLGSVFTQTSIPPVTDDIFRLRDKLSEDEDFQQPIVEDQPDTMDRNTLIRRTYHMANPDYRARSGDEAVSERWRQRDYYIDEEEGFTRPPGVEDGPSPHELEAQTDGDADEPPTPEHERPRWSRSSSRVRFLDDVDLETRSNASTSSRPIGERWGGYEIPEPEKDLGKEVLYQITQQAFNELLDPLFKDKEDNAMDAFATRAERRTCASQIDRILEDFQHKEKDTNRTVVTLGEYRYAGEVVDLFCKNDIMSLARNREGDSVYPEELMEAVRSLFAECEQRVVKDVKTWDDDWECTCDMWNAKLYRVQLEEELVHAVLALATRFGWLPNFVSDVEAMYDVLNVEEPVYRDPTLPQFRPNSLVDMESALEEATGSTTSTTAMSIATIEGYFRPPFGPLFVLAEYQLDVDVTTSEAPRPSDDHSPTATPAAPTPPSTHADEGEGTATPQNPQTPNQANDPMMQLLSIDPVTLQLRTHGGYTQMQDWMEPLHRRIRHEAINNPDSPLHLPFLASLVPVEREINERKGSGLLNFEEFEAYVRPEKLRFLESWMDWVSF
ncbi:hypothetical protein K458DRAFT_425705 [Lentithecium fluviatile CBS 122367]|uniref:EF-hand n=1 Tax=Lentithecium fluviatile CBS 122367 TaxID=1168545 RepID=A0A6G1JMQ4_9PLEO|nr:hypothetical protein K458DRAFT_425705 [Lentithecium fluviatile CBS 122367]